MMRSLAVLVLAAAMAAPAGAAQAQFWRQAPQSQEQVRLSYAPVVKRAAPAVVNVHVRRRVRTQSTPFFDDPWFRQFFGHGFGLPRERVENSLGSGVIVDPAGIVVTNNHVIEGRGEAEIKVAMTDRREFTAQVVLTDEQTDLAVLKLEGDGETFPYLEFADSDALEVGDLVLAIGNPFGVGQTVTGGIVSALARTRVGVSDYQFFIQTDAAINPGNSGGALVDMEGRLAGINTAIYSRTGGSHGIGFATPANMVRLVVESALTGTRVQRPWLGARLQPVTTDIAESLGLDRPAGALVTDVVPRGPADRAGLIPGDVVVDVDERPVADPRAFLYRFSTKGLGGKAEARILRGGTMHDVAIPLEAAPEDPPRDVRQLTGGHPLTGVRVANLSPALADEIGLDDTASGVVVKEIAARSPARRFMQPGDIVLSLNGRDVRTTAELAELVRQPARSWQLAVRRGDRRLNFVFGG